MIDLTYLEAFTLAALWILFVLSYLRATNNPAAPW